MKGYRKFSILFALILLLQILVSYTGNSTVAAFLSSFLVFSLLIFLYVQTRLKGRFHKRIFTGLVFALLAALLLMYPKLDLSYVQYPSFAFAMCVICYIRAFYLDFRSAPELDKRGARIAISLCAVTAIAFYFILRPYLGVMKLPIMISILTGSMLVLMASFRNQRVNLKSFQLILFGAILLVISGSVLIVNNFVQPIGHARIWVTTGYAIGQYLIAIGAVERELIHNN